MWGGAARMDQSASACLRIVRGGHNRERGDDEGMGYRPHGWERPVTHCLGEWGMSPGDC